jgi:hypothetical protein
MKVSELTGAQLDYWVAKAEGIEPYWQHEGAPQAWVGVYFLRGEPVRSEHPASEMEPYCPSIDWVQGGPIIEREKIGLEPPFSGEDGGPWMAYYLGPPVEGSYHPTEDAMHTNVSGPTPLIAAMRAYVASRFGETVETKQER